MRADRRPHHRLRFLRPQSQGASAIRVCCPLVAFSRRFQSPAVVLDMGPGEGAVDRRCRSCRRKRRQSGRRVRTHRRRQRSIPAAALPQARDRELNHNPPESGIGLVQIEETRSGEGDGGTHAPSLLPPVHRQYAGIAPWQPPTFSVSRRNDSL
jgi:hypothetical protein